MTFGRYKSRTLRRVFVKTPGGRVVLHYRERKPSRPACAGCGGVLKGIKALRPVKARNTPKSEKKVSRPFGGNLCSACSRKAIIERFRK